MNNRSALTILSLAALLTFTGCSKPNGVAPANESAKSERSGSMSRAKAASLIQATNDFKLVGTQKIEAGEDTRQNDVDPPVVNRALQDTLEKLGYLEKQGTQNNLTAKGTEAAKGWSKQEREVPSFPADTWVVPVATGRELIEVTGITGDQGPQQSSLTAEFTWRWKLTPLAKEVVTANPAALAEWAPVRNGQAALRLYDDGWRVVQFTGF
jgi:hypothetical protein